MGNSKKKLKWLPDGLYSDGTYEWEKEADDWFPLQAPMGMPEKPDTDRLVRVVRTYEEIDWDRFRR